MINVPIPRERVQDPFEKNVPGIGVGRDPCRTPMQWNAEPHAGFSDSVPWLPVADDYPVVNVDAEDQDPKSMLTLYRRLLALRRASPALFAGKYEPVVMTGDLVAYVRRQGTQAFLVALNLGAEPYALSLTSLGFAGRVVLSSFLDREDETPANEVNLRADEGVILALA
jgi:alpha-glucosidase